VKKEKQLRMKQLEMYKIRKELDFSEKRKEEILQLKVRIFMRFFRFIGRRKWLRRIRRLNKKAGMRRGFYRFLQS